MNWIWRMFFASVAGSLTGLFWPVAVVAWKGQAGILMRAARGTGGAPGGMLGARRHSGSSVALKWLVVFFKLAFLPFAKLAGRIVYVLLLALVISTVAAAVGFAAFLGQPDVREGLQRLDVLAYFSAFNYGFTASTLVDTALRAPPSFPAPTAPAPTAAGRGLPAPSARQTTSGR